MVDTMSLTVSGGLPAGSLSPLAGFRDIDDDDDEDQLYSRRSSRGADSIGGRIKILILYLPTS